MTAPVALEWLDGPPETETGATWGVPWARGALSRDESFALGETPVQSWPTAFWPDGSVKWTGHAAAFGPDAEAPTLEPGASGADPDPALAVTETADAVEVDTGALTARFPREGDAVVESLALDGETVAADGRLLARRETREEAGAATVRREDPFESRVESVTVESEGPIRAVVLVEGVHAAVEGDREWLPFEVRFECFAGRDSLRVVHTFVYDGDPAEEFVAGLGLSFAVPTDAPAWDRHVRFAGDEGLFREPARQFPDPRDDRWARQLDGERLAPSGEWTERIEGMTPWDGFRLTQDSADHYRVEKTAGEGFCWVDAAEGRRSGGLAFAGTPDGGLAVGLKEGWEKHPSGLEVEGLLAEPRLTAWLWSPEAEAMDLRVYDRPRTDASGPAYGGVDAERSTARGVANTSELTLSVFDAVPDDDALEARASETREPTRPVPTPERLHDAGAFGRWSLPDRSTERRAWVEDQLDAATEFYRDEVERRRWYGFWDYGDVMHSYDEERHAWRSDVGGYAWQNTEQVPTMWFWYAFLRSGRADFFRLAAAQTRHTSEVDVYHAGPLAGLGTRHNVVHWGGSCKEPRVSSTLHHRFFYYLTGGDERLGAVFESVTDADFATLALDPMRNHTPDDEFPTHARTAPDWLSYSANWFTEWERFEDEDYREKLLRGLDDVAATEKRLFAGPTFGYDPETGHMHHYSDGNYGYTFLHCMGGPQFWPELADALDDDRLTDMIAETGAIYLDATERAAKLPDLDYGFQKLRMYATNMAGYAAARRDDPDLAAAAWDLLLAEEYADRRVPLPMETETVTTHREQEELPGVKTNTMSIWWLNAMACLAYVPEALPEPPA